MRLSRATARIVSAVRRQSCVDRLRWGSSDKLVNEARRAPQMRPTGSCGENACNAPTYKPLPGKTPVRASTRVQTPAAGAGDCASFFGAGTGKSFGGTGEGGSFLGTESGLPLLPGETELFPRM